MPETPTSHGEHPRGTLFLVGVYAAFFVLSWFAVYLLIYLRRGGVTP
jgi:hypothetical protein